MTTLNLTKDNFEQAVTEHDTVVVDFWAPWCAPCRSFAPVFEDAAERNPGVVFAKVNTDEQPELAGMFGIRSIPTLMIMRERVVLYHEPGALPASALEDILGKAQSLDMAQVHEELAQDRQDAQPTAEAADEAAGEMPAQQEPAAKPPSAHGDEPSAERDDAPAQSEPRRARRG